MKYKILKVQNRVGNDVCSVGFITLCNNHVGYIPSINVTWFRIRQTHEYKMTAYAAGTTPQRIHTLHATPSRNIIKHLIENRLNISNIHYRWNLSQKSRFLFSLPTQSLDFCHNTFSLLLYHTESSTIILSATRSIGHVTQNKARQCTVMRIFICFEGYQAPSLMLLPQ